MTAHSHLRHTPRHFLGSMHFFAICFSASFRFYSVFCFFFFVRIVRTAARPLSQLTQFIRINDAHHVEWHCVDSRFWCYDCFRPTIMQRSPALSSRMIYGTNDANATNGRKIWWIINISMLMFIIHIWIPPTSNNILLFISDICTLSIIRFVVNYFAYCVLTAQSTVATEYCIYISCERDKKRH